MTTTKTNIKACLSVAQHAVDLAFECNAFECNAVTSFAIESVAFSQARSVALTALTEIFPGAPELAEDTLNGVFSDGVTVVESVIFTITAQLSRLNENLLEDETDVFSQARGEAVDHVRIASICADVKSYTELLDEIEAVAK